MMRYIAMAIGFFGLLASGVPGWADTYYVASAGDDRNPGTETQPLRTIQVGVDRAKPGDTVVVRAGIYHESVVLRRSGTEGKPIIVRNYPDERPIIEPAGQSPGKGFLLQAEEGYQHAIGWITIEGFEIRRAHDGIKFYNAHDVVIRGNAIHDNLNQGILGNGHHVHIEGNIIAHNGFQDGNERSNLQHGIYATGTFFTINDNVIHSNLAYGIQVAGYDYDPTRHAGPEFAAARHWVIRHNTIAFQQNRAGIVIWQTDATECVVEQNIFYRNATHVPSAEQGIGFVNAGHGHIIRGNVFFAPDREHVDKAGENQPEGQYQLVDNLFDQDPQFVDAEHFDFRLRDGSPARGAGPEMLPR